MKRLMTDRQAGRRSGGLFLSPRSLLLLALGVVPLPACRPESARQLQPHEGFAPVAGGRIWYQVIGTGRGLPLILVHGGPGGTSCSYHRLKALGDDRPLILYDQLSTGRSDRMTDTTLWTVARFVDEIDSLRAHLKLDRFHIYGHSWGGSVVADYLITRRPTWVVSAVLGSPLISTSRWIADADTLRSRMPAPLQRVLAVHESAGTFEAPEYLAATDSFYARHMSRRQPPVTVPECAGVKGNDTLYRYMWGPTEFVATGTLRDFDRVDRLGEINVPVLFLTGEFDEARPETVRDFQQRVPGARLAIIPGSGHSVTRDNPEEVVRVIRDFLRSVEP
jgi:proline iminopeptidase